MVFLNNIIFAKEGRRVLDNISKDLELDIQVKRDTEPLYYIVTIGDKYTRNKLYGANEVIEYCVGFSDGVHYMKENNK